MRASYALVSLLGLSLVVAGCAPRAPETRGRVAEVNGELFTLADDDAEAESICAEGRCEPNYVYTLQLGRRRATPPADVRPPAPAPVPLPRGESADYARGVLRTGEAWNLTQGSREVVVAVIDTGVDLRHPDLRDNLWVNPAEQGGRPGVDDDGNGYVDDVHGWDFVNNRPNGQDDHGHGTHVAGTIAAAVNGSGVVGVAPNTRIMALKFLSATGAGDVTAAVRAIRYATANGAQILSNSWGGGGRSSFLEEAINAALARGLLFTAAAGNEAGDNDRFPSYPASYPGVIAVASSDERDGLSVFSNYGRASVLIAAPGSNIVSAYLGGGSGPMSGTSMATPQVSGALALARAIAPGLSRQRLAELLCSSAVGILTTRVACGRMDVYEFVRRVREAR